MSRARSFSVRGPDRAGLRLRGLVLVVALVLLSGAVWRTLEPGRDGRVEFDLVVSGLGDGAGPGTPIRLRGMAIGQVVAVRPVGVQRHRLTVGVDAARLPELSTTTRPRFVSATVFGSTALELTPMPGGEPLAAGAVLEPAERVENFTVTRILRDSNRAVAGILTDRLAVSLENAAGLTEAGAPLLTSALLLARSWQRAQGVPLGQVLSTTADVTEGVAAFAPSALGILTALASVEELDDDAATKQASATISEVSNLVFAFAGELVGALGPMAHAVDMLLDMVIPLNQSMRGVTPGHVRALLAGLDGALRNRDGQVTLDTEIVLGGPR
ncbi:Mce family protein [Nocardia jiangsuensis]|uniref:Mce family protein n=1 Tax=Nocardia jiangsuensis TaxID=1691563 RepID=A0ABV8DN91_9NOCA